LFRKYVDPDYGRPNFSKIFDIGIGILKQVKSWDSEARDVELTRGLGPTIRLRVQKVKLLDKTDIPESQQSIYECPWALEDFPGAVKNFEGFLWGSIKEEIMNRNGIEKRLIAFCIFGKAWQLATQKEGPV